MTGWVDRLNEDPTPWLLGTDQPAVRHLALRELVDRPAEHAAVVEA
jgi:hypothetical protein